VASFATRVASEPPVMIIDAERDQLRNQSRQPFDTAVGRPSEEGDVLAFDMSQFLQRVLHCRSQGCSVDADHKNADAPDLRGLLRTRRRRRYCHQRNDD
jgi:hypothetical protein